MPPNSEPSRDGVVSRQEPKLIANTGGDANCKINGNTTTK